MLAQQHSVQIRQKQFVSSATTTASKRKSLPPIASSSSPAGLFCSLCCVRRPPTGKLAGGGGSPSSLAGEQSRVPHPPHGGAATRAETEMRNGDSNKNGKSSRHAHNKNGHAAQQFASDAQDQQQKSRGGFFLRRHRSLSLLKRKRQQQHAQPDALPRRAPLVLSPLDLRSLTNRDDDDADGATPNNSRDYLVETGDARTSADAECSDARLEMGRAQGGWMRDAGFWARQQRFWRGGDATRKKENDDVAAAEDEEADECMETARTSRTQDIAHYPSMNALIDGILAVDKELESMEKGEGGRKKRESARRKSACEEHMNGVLISATAASSQSAAHPPPPPPSATAFPPPVFFDSVSVTVPQLRIGKDATVTTGSTAATVSKGEGVLGRFRTGLPALTQSLFDVLTLTYWWIATSVAFLLQWLLP